MNLEIKNKIDSLVNDCLNDKVMARQDMIDLIDLDPASEEVAYLREKAHEVSREITGDTAFLWGAMGIDYTPCEMNCKFCTFGKAWNIVEEDKFYSDDEIKEQMQEYLDADVHYIVLRTTEKYDVEKLREKVANFRKAFPGTYEFMLNIGDFDAETAQKLHESGVDGVYHALRLREGEDTDFNPEDRKATLQVVHDSPLQLISLVEPVGVEHSAEELADNFLSITKYGANISGIMARVPVKGTPLGDAYEMISEERIAQLTAVFRLAGGRKTPDICTHPPSKAVAKSGANVAVVETGAVPRDDQLIDEAWHSYTAEGATKNFIEAGYRIKP